MKKLLNLFFILFISNNIFSQSGTVIYNVQINVDLTEVPKDKVDFITQMVNGAKNQQFELVFNKLKSSFKLVNGLDKNVNVNMENISRAAFTSSSDIYIDLDQKREVHKNSDGTLIENKYNVGNWKVSTESKKIAGYLCYKASLNTPFVNRKGETMTNETVCWFTPSLPFSYGPKNFNGLPGLILELTEKRTTYLATKIILEKKYIKIDLPKGKTISKEEYEKKLKASMGM